MTFALFLLWTSAAAAQPNQRAGQESPGSAAALPWDDPDRFRALAERTEPWPLRDYPPPPYWPPPKFACELGEGLPIVLGQTQLRLPFFNYLEPLIQTDRAAIRQLELAWRRLPAATRCALPAGSLAAPPLSSAYLEFASLATGQLDGRCYQPGLPGDPRPECDRPRNGAWWLTFVRGVPLDITLDATNRHSAFQSIPDGEPIDGLLSRILRDPGHRVEPGPRGGQVIRDSTGRFGGVILPRLGDAADTREPLFVSCLLSVREWRPPTPSALRAWTRCEVRYRHRGLVDVAYRFYREVFDEPDIPALDLRVRGFVQQMLDGGTRTQPAQSP